MKLEWDKAGERRFEGGVDRGVIYLPGIAVPWNGLSNVSENLGAAVVSYYSDGVKYMDAQVAPAYSGTLEAFTYPEELDSYMGFDSYAPGVFLHNQRAKTFSMAYRTLIANDTEGIDYGYRLHILYNVMAVPDDFSFDSFGEKVEAKAMKFTLTGTPPAVSGIKPTSHISLHSRLVDPDLLAAIEDQLYGTEFSDPALPSFVDLMGIVEASMP